jgi:hypothetical protein
VNAFGIDQGPAKQGYINALSVDNDGFRLVVEENGVVGLFFSLPDTSFGKKRRICFSVSVFQSFSVSILFNLFYLCIPFHFSHFSLFTKPLSTVDN